MRKLPIIGLIVAIGFALALGYTPLPEIVPPDIVAPPAVAWMNPAIVGGGSEDAAPAGGQDYTVDFSEYTATDDHYDGGSGPTWIELACNTGGDADCMTTGGGTTVDVSNDYLDTPANQFVILYPDQTDTITQYGSITLGLDVQYTGLYFRSTNNSGEYAYALRKDSGTDIQWRDCTGYSCSDIDTCNPGFTVGSNDSIGFRVTGTGTDTTLEVWGWDNAAAPTVTDGDVDTAWGAADCTLTGNPNNAADTGKYGGLYNGATSADVHDNFLLGDSTN